MTGRGKPARQPRTIAAAFLLAAGVIAWSAIPLSAGRSGMLPAFAAAIVTGLLSLAQLVLANVELQPAGVEPVGERLLRLLLTGIRAFPWADLLIVAVLVVEVLHPAHPWHTAVLGVALLGYVLAVHLAESRAGRSVLRAQLPLLAAGVGLAALAIGATALPALPGGPVTTAVGVIASAGAVAVAWLVVPTWLGRGE